MTRGWISESCSIEPRRAGLDLVGLWIAVARGAALHHVADVDLLAGEPDLAEHAVQQLSGRAHERLALLVLVEARPLADEHQLARRGRPRRTRPACGPGRAGTSCSRMPRRRPPPASGSRVTSALRASTPSWPWRVRAREHRRREGADLAIELDRSLHHRDVPGVLEQHEPSVRQRCRELETTRRRRHAIVLAHHHERRHGGCGATRDAGRSRAAQRDRRSTPPTRPVRPGARRARPRAGGVGAELREPHDGPAQIGGARQHRLAETVDALGGRAERAEPRPHEVGDRPHRAAHELGCRRADEHDAGHRGREHVGPAPPPSRGSRSRPCCGPRSPHACPAPPPRAPRRCRAPSIAPTDRGRPDARWRRGRADPSARTGDPPTGRPTALARSSCRG